MIKRKIIEEISWAKLSIWGAATILWLYLWKTPIWSIDDLYFATRSENPYGKFTFHQFLDQAIYDLGERNGRTADLLGQIIFSAGPFVGPIMAIICISFSVTFYLAIIKFSNIANARHAELLKNITSLTAVSIPFVIHAYDSTIAGSTIFFMSATVGYVLGGTFLFSVIVLSISLIERNNFSFKMCAFLVVLIPVTSTHHENLAVGVIAFFVATLIFYPKVLSNIKFIVLAIYGILVGSLRMLFPGMWARSSIVGELLPASEASFVKRHTVYVIRMLEEDIVDTPAFYVLLVLAFFVYLKYGVTKICMKKKKMLIGGYVTAVILLFGLSWKLSSMSYFARSGTEGILSVYSSVTALAFMFTALALLFFMLVIFLVERNSAKNASCAIAFVTALGLFVIPAYMGISQGRPVFNGYSAILLVSLILVFNSFDDVINLLKLVPLLVISGLVAPVVSSAPNFVDNMTKNMNAWGAVNDQISKVRSNDLDTVLFPKDLPVPSFSTNYAGSREESTGDRLRLYYGLPENTVFKWS
ncbi:hypothetical protein HMPREF9306_00023 [Propionimicrobium lymphophilum ACS-093-V-SCH5]|uniref:Glycosyltransferase RgtA/B/C/D-like domain-containing protein n=1 Tax=Propionimicrobium lymphophilum ACS-093-V-SCH5 TaxID=883161 RepID=S2W6Y5_9ACTN|nr:hypothetical protein [Propionimicrobium lymphophilum]EPD33990.1 hypothetical protein HMPREF9306_00023 [Propionimicrobium lymphophilum ACS-093-V-SCH5]